MKKISFLLSFLKSTTCKLILVGYSILFMLYLAASFFTFVGVVFSKNIASDSTLEESIRWFFNHPAFFIAAILMTVPGILILSWDKIKKWYEEKNSSYVTNHQRPDYRSR